MSFTWDWMLSNLISYGILDYYQANVALNRSDILLYRMGRGMGPMVTEAHIIKRMSGSSYRVMSFDFDTVTCMTCKNVHDVCKYITRVFIPQECRKVAPGAYLEALRKRREERASALNVDSSQCNLYGEFDYEIYKAQEEFIEKVNSIRYQRIAQERAGQGKK